MVLTISSKCLVEGTFIETVATHSNSLLSVSDRRLYASHLLERILSTLNIDSLVEVDKQIVSKSWFFIFLKEENVDLLFIKIIHTAIANARTNVNLYWDAPIAIPIHTLIKMNDKVYGSLTAVLNLITDKAPTKPRDKAKEDLTTAISADTHTVTIKIVFP